MGCLCSTPFGNVQYEGIVQDIDYDKVQYIAFCIAGILIIAKAVPDLVNSLYQIIAMASPQISSANRIYNSLLAKVIGEGIQSILGFWLVLGTDGIINAINKLRTAGIDKGSQQE